MMDYYPVSPEARRLAILRAASTDAAAANQAEAGSMAETAETAAPVAGTILGAIIGAMAGGNVQAGAAIGSQAGTLVGKGIGMGVDERRRTPGNALGTMAGMGSMYRQVNDFRDKYAGGGGA